MTGNGSSCGACKFLRRRCTRECVFAPYFCYEQAASHFAAVHKIFGASNASKLLLHLPVQSRSEAAVTISYEALARMQDPIYGCVAQIFALQQQVATLKEEIETIGNQITRLAFDVPIGETFQANNDSNNELVWCHDMNLQNCINQHIPLLPHTSNMSANQAGNSQMMEQNPPINGWKDDIPQLYSNSNILEMIFDEMGQNVYMQAPWTEE